MTSVVGGASHIWSPKESRVGAAGGVGATRQVVARFGSWPQRPRGRFRGASATMREVTGGPVLELQNRQLGPSV